MTPLSNSYLLTTSPGKGREKDKEKKKERARERERGAEKDIMCVISTNLEIDATHPTKPT